jgi:hypothetical protein
LIFTKKEKLNITLPSLFILDPQVENLDLISWRLFWMYLYVLGRMLLP